MYRQHPPTQAHIHIVGDENQRMQHSYGAGHPPSLAQLPLPLPLPLEAPNRIVDSYVSLGTPGIIWSPAHRCSSGARCPFQHSKEQICQNCRPVRTCVCHHVISLTDSSFRSAGFRRPDMAQIKRRQICCNRPVNGTLQPVPTVAQLRERRNTEVVNMTKTNK